MKAADGRVVACATRRRCRPHEADSRAFTCPTQLITHRAGERIALGARTCGDTRGRHLSRVVVITGASAGVGRAAARAFAERGVAVALLARGPDGLREPDIFASRPKRSGNCAT